MKLLAADDAVFPVVVFVMLRFRRKKPWLPTQALANGNWLGRHPEILRQMPYAHRLLLPTARVISQRVVFAAAGGQDWEHALKQHVWRVLC